MRRAHSKVSGFGPHGVGPMVWAPMVWPRRRRSRRSSSSCRPVVATDHAHHGVTRRKRGGRSGIVFGHQTRSEGQLDQPGALLILRQVLDPEFLEKCA